MRNEDTELKGGYLTLNRRITISLDRRITNTSLETNNLQVENKTVVLYGCTPPPPHKKKLFFEVLALEFMNVCPEIMIIFMNQIYDPVFNNNHM